jgi:hypothetical protein
MELELEWELELVGTLLAPTLSDHDNHGAGDDDHRGLAHDHRGLAHDHRGHDNYDSAGNDDHDDSTAAAATAAAVWCSNDH